MIKGLCTIITLFIVHFLKMEVQRRQKFFPKLKRSMQKLSNNFQKSLKQFTIPLQTFPEITLIYQKLSRKFWYKHAIEFKSGFNSKEVLVYNCPHNSYSIWIYQILELFLIIVYGVVATCYILFRKVTCPNHQVYERLKWINISLCFISVTTSVTVAYILISLNRTGKQITLAFNALGQFKNFLYKGKCKLYFIKGEFNSMQLN